MKDPGASEQLRCVLVADDLTGACDSAVQFSARGTRAIVYLDSQAGGDSRASVKAFTTDTRDAEEAEVKARIRRVAAAISALDSQLVFKKIDSLMRGRPGTEIAAALEAFGCDLAIITPAFPDMGRTVENGRLHVSSHEGWEPFEIAPRLRAQGLVDCVHLAPGELTEAIRAGARYLSLDIRCNRDLEELVGEALDSGRRVLWAGSGGLAAALAAVLFSNSLKAAPRPLSTLPVVFCIGSDHPVTAAQMASLRDARRTAEFDAGHAHASDLTVALEDGCHVIVRIPRNQFDRAPLKSLFEPLHEKAAAFALSGGDTASAVCLALGVQEIEIKDQIVTGLPWGILRGGPFDQLPAATKSGAFGREDALIRVADFFTCRKI